MARFVPWRVRRHPITSAALLVTAALCVLFVIATLLTQDDGTIGGPALDRKMEVLLERQGIPNATVVCGRILVESPGTFVNCDYTLPDDPADHAFQAQATDDKGGLEIRP